MNLWMIAAAVLLLGFIPCGIVCLRGGSMDRLIGLEMSSVVTALVLLLLAEGYERQIYFDVPLTAILLSLGGTLVFARFLERWL